MLTHYNAAKIDQFVDKLIREFDADAAIELTKLFNPQNETDFETKLEMIVAIITRTYFQKSPEIHPKQKINYMIEAAHHVMKNANIPAINKESQKTIDFECPECGINRSIIRDSNGSKILYCVNCKVKEPLSTTDSERNSR